MLMRKRRRIPMPGQYFSWCPVRIRAVVIAGATVAVATGTAGSMGGTAAVAQQPGERCAVGFLQAVVPADTTIVSAQVHQDPVPRCKVDGYVTTVNPGPNRVGFTLQLPLAQNWKGRYYFIAV